MSYGIVLYEPKHEANWGTLVRTAFNFRADFLVTIGNRYGRLKSDTVNATKHLAVQHYATLDEFIAQHDWRYTIVTVEVDADDNLPGFVHPEHAVYVFGGEDRSVPRDLPGERIGITTRHCLNLSVAGGIVMYDRQIKTAVSS